MLVLINDKVMELNFIIAFFYAGMIRKITTVKSVRSGSQSDAQVLHYSREFQQCIRLAQRFMGPDIFLLLIRIPLLKGCVYSE